MSDESKSFEKKLDRDFLHYLNLTKGLFENIKNDTEKQICEVWLTHLVGKTICSLVEKCDRNIFLSRLLLQMQNGELKGIFRDTPPSGKLPCAFFTFELPSEVDGLKGFEDLGFQVDSNIGGGSGDFFESSRDGRIYLATKHLREGMMAFMAVTNNDGEDIWVPQTCSAVGKTGENKNENSKSPGKFIKKLSQFIGVPISCLRKSPEDREKILEWIDKIISDCNKWIQGEDPHNMDLEALFEYLYEDYKQHSTKSEILKHPKKIRNILMRDIRDIVSERRSEITKRELILDQYEADQFIEERIPKESLDEVWLQCAKKPMADTVRSSLEAVYPPEVIQRFFELLFQERLSIIEKGEREADKKIAELRRASLDEIKKELQKLQKAQNEYKEYYCVYLEIEKKAIEYEKGWIEKCAKSEKPEQQQMIEKVRRELEYEIDQAKLKLDKERKTQIELSEKLDEARDCYMKLKDKMTCELEKLNCERNHLQFQKDELESQICKLRRRRDELKYKLMCKKKEFPPYR